MIAIAARAADVMLAHCAAQYPAECCGAIVGDAGGAADVVRGAWPVENAERDAPTRRFEIPGVSYRDIEARAEREGLALLGFYHSHPDAPAAPSQTDVNAAWPTFTYIIVSVVNGTPGEASGWRLTADRASMAREEITWLPGS